MRPQQPHHSRRLAHHSCRRPVVCTVRHPPRQQQLAVRDCGRGSMNMKPIVVANETTIRPPMPAYD
ncbi:unnamed protein product [Toxocara canis]|uniref:Uncharacterized protein n=1 Tax=Toxocara canis TaxID=6265 RepID=A0A3P7H529_TOXCA|nr:unnamed protein product [Toxocara canis]